jgi:hypothetical protein
MALYVVQANQEMLWNVINKNAFIQQYFEKFSPETQHQWFQQIIRYFYEKYKSMNITVNDLHTINRDTIAYMMDDVRKKVEAVPPAYSSFGQPSMHAPIQITPEIKQDAYQNDYQKRKMEYEQMTERKAPENIDFREKSADTAISNMDELIKEQLQQREIEFTQYAPPNIPQSIPTVSSTKETASQDSPKPITEVSTKETNTDTPSSTEIDELKALINKLNSDLHDQKSYITLMNETIRTLQEQIAEVYKLNIHQLSPTKSNE